MKLVDVDATLPQSDMTKAVTLQLALQRRRARHGGERVLVEPPFELPHQLFGHERKSRVDIFRKARVECSGELDAVLEADGARAQPHRAFGGDVHRLAGACANR